MELKEYWAPFQSDGESVDAFFCIPSRLNEKMPAILLIQEIWGVDDHIQDMARRYASAGYLVCAPDLYSKGGKPAPRSTARINELKEFLDKAPMHVIMDPAQRKKFLEKEEPDKAGRLVETMDSIFTGRDMEGMKRTLDDAASFLVNKMQATGVGTVGYCMGGALSFLIATNANVNGSVVYYGSAPESSKLKEIRAPVLGLYGGEDHGISDKVPSVADEMRSLKKSYEYKIYNGAQHAFFNDTRSSYGYEAARDAWARTLEFFRVTLK